MIWSA